MNEALRNLSSDIVVISIALLGVTFVLVALVWKRFVSGFMALPLYWRREYLKLTTISFVIPILIPMVVYTAVGVYYPSLAQNSVVLVMALIAVIFIMYLLFEGVRWIIDFIRNRRKSTIKIRLDWKVTAHLQSMFCLALSVMCTILALLGCSSSALDIYVGQNQVESFNWSRYLLNDGILFFIFGVYYIGSSYLPNRKSKSN